jgi:hypothetical protein
VAWASERNPAAIAAVPGSIAVVFDVAAAVVVVVVWVGLLKGIAPMYCG